MLSSGGYTLTDLAEESPTDADNAHTDVTLEPTDGQQKCCHMNQRLRSLFPERLRPTDADSVRKHRRRATNLLTAMGVLAFPTVIVLSVGTSRPIFNCAQAINGLAVIIPINGNVFSCEYGYHYNNFDKDACHNLVSSVGGMNVCGMSLVVQSVFACVCMCGHTRVHAHVYDTALVYRSTPSKLGTAPLRIRIGACIVMKRETWCDDTRHSNTM